MYQLHKIIKYWSQNGFQKYFSGNQTSILKCLYKMKIIFVIPKNLVIESLLPVHNWWSWTYFYKDFGDEAETFCYIKTLLSLNSPTLSFTFKALLLPVSPTVPSAPLSLPRALLLSFLKYGRSQGCMPLVIISLCSLLSELICQVATAGSSVFYFVIPLKLLPQCQALR